MLPTAVLVWIGTLSVVDFGLAVFDKGRARRGRGRVPEATLLGIAFLGGSPGLVLGMLLVRHKTRKLSFLAAVAVILLLQGLLLFWVGTW